MSQIGNSMNEDGQVLKSTDSLPVVTVVNDSKNVLVGVEHVIESDVVIDMYPKKKDEKLHAIGMESLRVDGKQLVKKSTKDGVIVTTDIEDKKFKRCMGLLAPVLTVIMIIAALVVCLILYFESVELHSDPLDKYYPVTNIMIHDNTEYPTNAGINFVHRYNWSAKPPGKGIRRLMVPGQRVIISHTATVPCHTVEACKEVVKIVQRFHIYAYGFQDIGYNFLIGGDGSVYVGRGWNHVGAHTLRRNFDSMGISFIGTFTAHLPTNAQLETTLELIKFGETLGKLIKNYTVNAHCQFSKTVSPGRSLYGIISKWDRFTHPLDSRTCPTEKNDRQNISTTEVPIQFTTSKSDYIAATGSVTENAIYMDNEMFELGDEAVISSEYSSLDN